MFSKMHFSWSDILYQRGPNDKENIVKVTYEKAYQ